MDITELIQMCSDLDLKYKDDETKESLIMLVIKEQGGISKMKVNNQVASNPIGFYEESKNLINKDINILKTSSVGSNLFQIFLLYLVLVGTAIFLRKIPIFIILAEFLIFIIIQIFSKIR